MCAGSTLIIAKMSFISIGSPIYEGLKDSTPSPSPGFDFENILGTGYDFVMDGDKLQEHFHMMFHQVFPQPK